MFKCIKSDSNNYRSGSRTDSISSSMEFIDDPDCLNLKSFSGDVQHKYNTTMNYTYTFGNYLHSNKYIADLKACKNKGWGFVCVFNGNNPLKLKEIYISSNGQPETSHCWYTGSRTEKKCLFSGASTIGASESRKYSSMLNYLRSENNTDKTIMGLWDKKYTGNSRASPNTKSYIAFFKHTNFLFKLLQKYLSDVEQNNHYLLPIYPKLNGFNIIGTRFNETKNIDGFLTDICINNIGCYGKDKDAGKLLVNIGNIQQISDITFHNYKSKDISKTNEPKRWGCFVFEGNGLPLCSRYLGPLCFFINVVKWRKTRIIQKTIA